MADLQLMSRSLDECERVIKRGLATFVEVGEALMAIRDQRLYREKGYSRFEDYCQQEWGWSRIHAYRHIEAARVAALLPIGNMPATESQARELVPLMHDDERLVAETWQEIRDERGDDVTASYVRDVVRQRLMAHQLISQSTSNEWYTPPEYVEAARAVMGAIDLDPASNHTAQAWIKASRYYTPDDDGLACEWCGRVWLNPPWGQLTGQFVSKLADELVRGHVEQAIVLVNAHATDTQWFSPLWDGLLCFTDHRINYLSSDEVGSSGSTHGSVFVYFGENHESFGKAFGRWGVLVRRVRYDD